MINAITIRFRENETKNIVFATKEIAVKYAHTQIQVNEAEFNKLEKWLESESNSVSIKCTKGDIMFLNKYGIEYAMASEEK
ncbi:hypothetical protein [Clostridium sp.]|uniref:hypothetical protein n=1 Tax=Clostridium sp. TaxID=1506 RepID=UPI002847058D|nr:hypothetical protein [Clostridium sp.]MDR3594152.1 hypothetical protein [Clostridium sp.]